jgi:hypothetical protein
MRPIAVHLMPYMEQDNLYKTFLPGGTAILTAQVPPFLSPSDFSTTVPNGVENFAANIRVFSQVAAAAPGTTTGAITTLSTGALAIGNVNITTVVNTGVAAGSFDSMAYIPRSFLDGTSNCIIFATKYGYCGATASYNNYASSPNAAVSAAAGAGLGAFFGAQKTGAVGASPTASGATEIFQVQPTVALCDNTYPSGPPQSFYTGGIQVGIADGTTRTIAPSISVNTWLYAITPADGTPLPSDWD